MFVETGPNHAYKHAGSVRPKNAASDSAVRSPFSMQPLATTTPTEYDVPGQHVMRPPGSRGASLTSSSSAIARSKANLSAHAVKCNRPCRCMVLSRGVQLLDTTLPLPPVRDNRTLCVHHARQTGGEHSTVT